MSPNSSNVLVGVLLLGLIIALGKMYADNSMPESYYSFTVNDRQIGRYENMLECAKDEMFYRKVHLQENITAYQSSCEWIDERIGRLRSLSEKNKD